MTIIVDFIGEPLTGSAPLAVQFTSTVAFEYPNVTEIPVEKLTADEFSAIGVKNITSSLPAKWYDDGNYPLRNISVWPIPTKRYPVKLWLWQPLLNVADLDTDIEFPKGYERALRYALAVELAAEFGKEVPNNVKRIALLSKSVIKRLNSVPQIMQGDIAIASSKSSYFNYITGDTIPNNM